MKPKFSCRNLTLEPATAMLPSKGVFGLAIKSYATVVSNPWVDITGLSPTLYSKKHPVPYVFFAIPGVEPFLANERCGLISKAS